MRWVQVCDPEVVWPSITVSWRFLVNRRSFLIAQERFNLNNRLTKYLASIPHYLGLLIVTAHLLYGSLGMIAGASGNILS